MEEENKLLKQMVQMLTAHNSQLVEQVGELTARIDILLARIDEEVSGTFPEHITATKQYGNNLKAFATALSTVGMVSTGAIQNWVKQL